MKAAMSDSVVIRSPLTSDLEALASLLGELGYPVSPSAVASRLDRLAQHADIAVLVADRSGTPVGLATAHIIEAIHVDEPVAMLTALVVAEHHRGRGIGRMLVDAAEAWSVRSGALRITVASGLARAVAHAFYEAMGYENTARRYSKILGRPER